MVSKGFPPSLCHLMNIRARAPALLFLPLSIEISPSHQLNRKNFLSLAFNIRSSCFQALSYLLFYLVSERVDWIEAPEKANRPLHQQVLQFPCLNRAASRLAIPFPSSIIQRQIPHSIYQRENFLIGLDSVYNIRKGRFVKEISNHSGILTLINLW